MSKETLMRTSLPKWSSCVIWGKRVTEKQAAEVILKTDRCFPDFTYGSNYHCEDRQLNELMGIPYGWAHDASHTFKERMTCEDNVQTIRRDLGCLNIQYLHNDRISTSYICGLSGWMDWSGCIFQNNKNIGKWPSVEDVLKDWTTIAEAFPFLNLTCTLHNGEQCEDSTEAVVSFKVENGVAELIPPIDAVPSISNMSLVGIFGSASSCVISPEFLQEKLELVYGRIPITCPTTHG